MNRRRLLAILLILSLSFFSWHPASCFVPSLGLILVVAPCVARHKAGAFPSCRRRCFHSLLSLPFFRPSLYSSCRRLVLSLKWNGSSSCKCATDHRCSDSGWLQLRFADIRVRWMSLSPNHIQGAAVPPSGARFRDRFGRRHSATSNSLAAAGPLRQQLVPSFVG